MARIRVQGKTRRSGQDVAADRAVPPSSRLADVVRGVHAAATGRVVYCAPSPDPSRRRGNVVSSPDQTVTQPSTALSARTLLSVSVYDSGRAAPDGSLVAPAARGRVRSRNHPRSFRPI